MALFKNTGKEYLPKPVIPQIAAPAYQSVQNDLRYQSREDIVSYISGHPWVVPAYYSQVLGLNTALRGRSLEANPVDQQFTKILDFELKVDSPISGSQDENRNMVLTGSANVYSCLVPQEGDQFVGDIGDGRLGIFSVTTTTRLTNFKNSIHQIEFQLINYASEGELRDVERKTVKTLHFRREYLDYGRNPLIEDQDHGWSHKFDTRYHDLLGQWFSEHFSREYSTLLVPGQPTSTYDPFITKTVTRFWNSRVRQEFSRIQYLNLSQDEGEMAKTIWDVIVDPTSVRLNRIATQSVVVSAKTFTRPGLFNSVYHSGVGQVVYPTGDFYQIDNEYAPRDKGPGGQLQPTRAVESPETSEDTGEPTKVLIHPVTIDSHYVLSEAFYTNGEGQSALELELRRHINQEGFDLPILIALLEDSDNWEGLERFYYIPILLILMQSAVSKL